MKLLSLSSCCVIAWLCFANAVAARSGTQVYLLRGIFNVSVGLDALAGKLARRGIPASVYGHGEAASVTSAAMRDYRNGKSIVLIGHSLGAGAAITVAQQLAQAGIPVALLISLDPVASGAVPGNVRRAVNFYIAGSGAPLTAAPGFRGSLSNLPLKGASMTHMSIQAADSMHQRIIGYLR